MSRFLRIRACPAWPAAVLAIGLCGCDPQASMVVRDGSVELRSMEPAPGTPLGAAAVLKFSYRWEARQHPGPRAVLSVSMRFDRSDGGVRSWTLLEGGRNRSGADSGAIFLSPEIVAGLRKPVCGRLRMTETVDDSLVAFLAESGEFCWAQ